MTIGERVLNAVDQEATIQGLTDPELVELLDELSGRTWWNDFWSEIGTLTAEETINRFCTLTKSTQS